MELTTYIETLRRELGSAAEVAGPDVSAAAERLAMALDPAVRMTLIEVLSDAADEVTRQIDPGVVELRIRGREPQFVVTAPLVSEHAAPMEPPAPPAPPAPPVPGEGEDGTARMTLRLPESLKSRIEQSAASAGVSVNAWLVRALGAAVGNPQSGPPFGPPPGYGPPPGRSGPGKRISGWAR